VCHVTRWRRVLQARPIVVVNVMVSYRLLVIKIIKLLQARSRSVLYVSLIILLLSMDAKVLETIYKGLCAQSDII
jgi:hypothetical protein